MDLIVSENEGIKKITLHLEQNKANSAVVDESLSAQSIDSFPNINAISKIVKHRLFTPLVYTASGIFLFCAIIIIFDTYVLRLKVETAVVTSMIETMVAPMGGYITNIYVDSGERVNKGAPLLTIENMDLEQALQMARVQVEESKLNVNYYNRLIKNEQQRLKVYKNIGLTRVKSAKTRVKASMLDVITAQHHFERYQVLKKKNYISTANLEDAQAQYRSAQEKLKNAKAHQQLENHSLRAVKKGMYFTGTKTEGIEQDLYAELNLANKKVALNEARVKVYENLIHKLTIVAPFEGIVTQLLKSPGSTTGTTQPLLFIEKRNANKLITAYLTQDEIIHIGTSKAVKIYIPSSGNVFHGRIMNIDRTNGFIDEIKAQYRWRDFQIDRSATVTIALNKDEQTRFDKRAFSGLPVTIYFSRKSIS